MQNGNINNTSLLKSHSYFFSALNDLTRMRRYRTIEMRDIKQTRIIKTHKKLFIMLMKKKRGSNNDNFVSENKITVLLKAFMLEVTREKKRKQRNTFVISFLLADNFS